MSTKDARHPVEKAILLTESGVLDPEDHEQHGTENRGGDPLHHPRRQERP